MTAPGFCEATDLVKGDVFSLAGDRVTVVGFEYGGTVQVRPILRPADGCGAEFTVVLHGTAKVRRFGRVAV